MKKQKDIGRLAFRHEGLEWIAYYARQDSMEGALRLGAINFNLALQSKPIKEGFMELMKQVVAEMVRETMNTELDWHDPVEAPEGEKSGHS